jgi:uncharacterized protein YyaL (SSP411 family)
MRAKLLARREHRVRPGWDDKVLADWNGLMIAALARASRVFDQPAWLDLAVRAFAFIRDRMTVDGRLIHSYRAGQAKAPATASDYANMIWGAVRLYEATNDPQYLNAATGWADILGYHYWDADSGGYATSAGDTPDVIVRLKTAHDDATPSANAIMVTNLVHLFLLTGRSEYLEKAEALPHAFAADLERNLIGHSGLLANMLDLVSPQQIVVVHGGRSKSADALVEIVNGLSLPGALQQVVDDTTSVPDQSPLAGKSAVDGKTTAYVCIGPQCSPPITEPERLEDTLRAQRQAKKPDAS